MRVVAPASCRRRWLLVLVVGTLGLCQLPVHAEKKMNGAPGNQQTGRKCSASYTIPSTIDSIPYGGSAASRILAKDEEETVNLEVSSPLSQSFQVSEREAPLMKDIQLLSDILADIVAREDAQVHDIFVELRDYGLERAAESAETGKGAKQVKAGVESALNKMIERTSKLDAKQALGVMRSFSIMLNLVNSAEVHHRNRMIRQHETEPNVRKESKGTGGGPLPLTEDSIRGTIEALLNSGLATKDQIYDQLIGQRAEIVLTAHPTQVQRKSLLRKYSQITELLAYMERPDISEFEVSAARDDLRRIISSIWGADEIRRTRPTPQQEASGGNAVLESVLWDAVPSYLRKLDTQCRISLGRSLPIDIVPIKFASWIGGDRDGKSMYYTLCCRQQKYHFDPRLILFQ